jgi:small subunit ribosomal protein S16
MLKIRLSRTGKRNSPSFRVVVTDHTAPVKAGYIEHIGFYNPQTKSFTINEDKLKLWMKKGATPSDTVNNLLVREKIFTKDKVIKVTRTSKKKEDEEKKEGAKKEEKEAPEVQKKDEKEKEAPKPESKAEAPEEKKEEPAKKDVDKSK